MKHFLGMIALHPLFEQSHFRLDIMDPLEMPRAPPCGRFRPVKIDVLLQEPELEAVYS